MKTGAMMPASSHGRHVPLRMCVVCRQRFARDELTRYVVDPAGALISDERKIMPGRGWYCCQKAACHAKFIKFRPKKKAGKGGKRLGSRG